FDAGRIRSLAVDVLAAFGDDELAARAGIPIDAVPLARGAHDLLEAQELAHAVLEPPARESSEQSDRGRLTLERFVELRGRSPERLDRDGSKSLLRELK